MFLNCKSANSSIKIEDQLHVQYQYNTMILDGSYCLTNLKE
jgi:hypothetical protein